MHRVLRENEQDAAGSPPLRNADTKLGRKFVNTELYGNSDAYWLS